MALTKDKLTAHVKTQIGMTKPESRLIVERLFEIMKPTLADGEDLLISGFGTFLIRQELCAAGGGNPQTKESLVLHARKGGSV